jgi:PAS domain S-box-containing protein
VTVRRSRGTTAGIVAVAICVVLLAVVHDMVFAVLGLAAGLLALIWSRYRARSAEPASPIRRSNLGAILRNTPTAFYVKDLAGRYEAASAEFEQMHGIPTGGAAGRMDREVHDPAYLAGLSRRERTLLTGTSDEPLVFEEERPGGRVLVTTLFALRDEAGELVGTCGVSTDVTRLRSAESKLAGLLDASPEAMICVDSSGRIVLANARALKIFRYAREDLVGAPVEALVPEGLHDRHVGYRDGYLRNPAPRPMGEGMHLTARRGDGTEFPVEISLAPVKSDGGTVVFAAVQDITDRLVQQQTDAQLAGIVAASSDAIVSKTLDGTILTWNPGAERLYGYTAAEMIGRDVTVILPPDRPDEERGLLHRVRGGELIKHHETRRVRKDGGTIYVSLSMAPVRNAAGAIVGASTISHDITAEVEAEQRLRIEREQFQMIMTAAADPFISMDHRGLITEWNRQAEQVFGWSREEVVGRRVGDTILPRRFVGALGRVLDGRWDWLLDRPTAVPLRHIDGAELPIELTVWRIRRDGPSSYHAFARDITVRRQTELALAQARDQAVETARLKSQFLASMSHEIRTPMNGVIGLSGLLLGTELGETQRRYAQGINSAGVALLSVINDILDFSKLESGKILLERTDFELWRLLDDVVGLVADGTGKTDLTVLSRCDPRLAAPLSGDIGKLRQVLLNLAGNAVKFTPHGQVEVLAKPVEGGDFPPGSLPVRFEVSDTGIGIDEDQQAGLFEPFTQADAGTTRRFGGTGLGLAISRELVGVLGGKIGLISEPGDGSTFWFTVPLWPAVGEETPQRHVLAGVRVLIVAGDTPLIDQLAAWSVEPLVAADGAAALIILAEAAAQGRPVHAVLLDGDPDLPAKIIAHPDIPTPKLIMIGGEPHLPPGRVRSAGFNATLTKPVRQSQLYDVLVDACAAPAEDRALRTTAAAPSGRGHVLLVEDNDINQTVALGILANLGYSADVAVNGREAVEMAARQEYQVIFMDCLMPEMDGYQATAEIRRRENDGRHVPIVAMTAGAMPEDRARCLAAGMDDHLAKPLMPADVAAALDGWTPATPQPPADSVRAEIEQRLELLRGAGAGLGPDAFGQLLRRLSAAAPGHLEEIFQALAMEDAETLRQQAHQLKGVAANLGVRSLADACDRVERVARDGDMDAAVEAVTELRPRTREMLEAVDAILSAPAVQP